MSFLKNIFSGKKISDLTSLQQSTSFCVMPWVHFHVTQQGTVTPCCQTPWQEEKAFGNINSQSIAEIWNNAHIKSFRKTILDGKTDERCASCFKREKSGFTSLRKITNHKYAHKQAAVIDSLKNNYTVSSPPVYFDIRFSNVCNLRCRICGPWSSSSWYNDALQLGMVDKNKAAFTSAFTNTSVFLAELEKNVDLLEELYFAGGEPLVTEEHYQLLEMLIRKNKTQVRLTYNTNFSSFKYKHYNVFELWKQFPNISIAASLDASHERAEFLRKNLVWEKVIENRRLIQQKLPHIEFVVSPTINVYNLLHLPDFHKEWVEQGFIVAEDFIPTLLVVPEELSVTGLPLAFRKKAIEKYQQHLLWIKSMPVVKFEKRKHMVEQFENVIKSLSASEEKPLEAFRKHYNALDKLRDENTLKVFPELKDLWQAI